MTYCVITSIQKPTIAVRKFNKLFGKKLIVVSDLKTPHLNKNEKIDYFDLKSQKESFPKFNKLLPYNNYSRKNLGYLLAIKNGADKIFETDDDNIPYANFRLNENSLIKGNFLNKNSWTNIYSYFTKEKIWPRGLSLYHTKSKISKFELKEKEKRSYINQYVVNKDPDVDAIYRLILDKHVYFNKRIPLILGKKTVSPFNSQSTLWFKKIFPLLYLPSYSSFRTCDIWRSLVAQVCLWKINSHVTFFSPNSYQIRNPHDYLKDFIDEIPGFVNNDKIVNKLLRCDLSSDIKDLQNNLLKCWKSIGSFLSNPDKELKLCYAFLNEVSKL
ncbi:DUF288 domain-containing protein [Candidatus Roizmanbacteria bacterium]|nr:DUF288 domain-containing protein [Candidatus Roizmanbacteria bacterium]